MAEASTDLRLWENKFDQTDLVLENLATHHISESLPPDLVKQVQDVITSGEALCLKYKKENTQPVKEKIQKLRDFLQRFENNKKIPPKVAPKPPSHSGNSKSVTPPTPPMREASKESQSLNGNLTEMSPMFELNNVKALTKKADIEEAIISANKSSPIESGTSPVPLTNDKLSLVEERVMYWENQLHSMPNQLQGEENTKNVVLLLKDLDAESLLHEAELESLSHQFSSPVPVTNKLLDLNKRWGILKDRAEQIRHILDSNAKCWEDMLHRLKGLNDWLATKDTCLRQRQLLLGGDLKSIREQICEHDDLVQELTSRKQDVEFALDEGEVFLQQDRPNSTMSHGHESGAESDSGMPECEDLNRRLNRRIRRNLHQLKKRWMELNLRVREYQDKLHLVSQRLSAFEEVLTQCHKKLSVAEKEMSQWPPLSSVSTQQLVSELDRTEYFLEGLSPVDQLVAALDRQSAALKDSKVVLTHTLVTRITELHQRHKDLRSAIDLRNNQLTNLRRPVQVQTPSIVRHPSPTPVHIMTSSFTGSMTGSIHSVSGLLPASNGPTFASPSQIICVREPWQRCVHPNGTQVPYFRNAQTQDTSWDHPVMTDFLQSLADLNYIRYSAYRTASKLRKLQKALYLDFVSLTAASDVFKDYGLAPAAAADRLIDVGQMTTCLASLFARSRAQISDHSLQAQTVDLSLNWLLNVYDQVRSGRMRVLSFKVGLVLLTAAGLEDKYKYLFAAVTDQSGCLDQRRLGLLLHDCMQIPRHLGEAASFGGSNIEPSVRSCFDKARGECPQGLPKNLERKFGQMPRDLQKRLHKDTKKHSVGSGIRLSHFLAWLRLEPQSLVWLPVLHRVISSENSIHPLRCNGCKCLPIRGLRYRCLKCFNLNICQDCFFHGKTARHHKVNHPMQEYVRAPGSTDSLKSLSRTLRNKLHLGSGRRRRELPGSPAKLGYLPVQTVREGQAIESPVESPAHTVSANSDMHSRLEVVAHRLAEVEQQKVPLTMDKESEDEHALIAAYAGSLRQRQHSQTQLQSPGQMMGMATLEKTDQMKQLEAENKRLQAEYEHLKAFSNRPIASPIPTPVHQPSSPASGAVANGGAANVISEARLLRAHKGRLEARMAVLEDHNKQLERQLGRLRHLLANSPSPQVPPRHRANSGCMSDSETALPYTGVLLRHGGSARAVSDTGSLSSFGSLTRSGQMGDSCPNTMGRSSVTSLFTMAGQVSSAMGQLVDVMNQDAERPRPA